MVHVILWRHGRVRYGTAALGGNVALVRAPRGDHGRRLCNGCIGRQRGFGSRSARRHRAPALQRRCWAATWRWIAPRVATTGAGFATAALGVNAALVRAPRGDRGTGFATAALGGNTTLGLRSAWRPRGLALQRRRWASTESLFARFAPPHASLFVGPPRKERECHKL